MDAYRTRDGKRRCGGCSVCCWLCGVVQLGKPPMTDCAFLDPSGDFGKCRIYERRPSDCSSYACSWLEGWFADDDRPDVSGVAFETSTLRNEGAGPDDPTNLVMLTGHVARLPAHAGEEDALRARFARWAAVAAPGVTVIVVSDDPGWSRVFGTVSDVREVCRFFDDIERNGVDDSLGTDAEGHPMIRPAR